MNRTDKIFYIIGLVLFTLLIFVAVLQNTGILVITDLGFPCSFYLATGYYCPGCGGTHAICSLAAGNIWESFRYHPLVPYTAACFGIFLIWNTVSVIVNHGNHKNADRRSFPFLHFHTVYVYIGIAIIFIQWFLKNFTLTLLV